MRQSTGQWALGGVCMWMLTWAVHTHRNGHRTAWFSTPEQNEWQRERNARRAAAGAL